MEENTYRRPMLIGAVIGLALGLATAAIAAVITITTTSSIGAGQVTISPCDTVYQVDTGTPTWDAAQNDFVVASVTYSGIDPTACAGEFVKVEVLDATNASIGFGATAVSATGNGTITLNTNVPVGNIDRVASALYTP